MKEQESLVKDYLSRPARYANVDGFNELTWGAILCWFASLAWIHTMVARHSLWHRPWAQGLYMVAGALAIHFGGKALKRYVTYPRSGFVAYPETPARRVVPLVAFAVAIPTTFLAAAVLRRGLHLATLLGASNLLFYAFAAWPLRPWKYGFLLLIAAGALWVPDAYALPFFGLTFLASGITTLTLYLRQTRSAE
jgi:hypothetical protein